MRRVGLKRTVTPVALIIRLAGEIDYASADEAAARLAQAALTLPPPEVVIVDLSRVSHLSAAGLRVVQCFAVSCAEQTMRARFVIPPGSVVRRVMGLLPLDPRLTVFDSVDQALRAGAD
jgi:anti-anti-sigma factor